MSIDVSNGSRLEAIDVIPEEVDEDDDNVLDITVEELTGTLGQLLDEVELPPDLHRQVQDLYDRAVKILCGEDAVETPEEGGEN